MIPNQQEVVDRVLNSMRLGEYLHAFDQAQVGLNDYPDDKRLQYNAVLALARIGATEQAQQRYQEYALDKESSVDSAALAARLVKDKALSSSHEDRQTYFLQAAALYEKIFLETHSTDYYPAINAATTYFLGGDKRRSAKLAKSVLKLCADAKNNYWNAASQAEAHLLLENSAKAIQSLEKANAYSSGDLTAIASTRNQLALITSDNTVLDALVLPTVIHFSGHIISPEGQAGRFPAVQEQIVKEEIAAMFESLNVGIAYGSLAAGADILFAEEVLNRGGEIHITLPFNIEEFKQVSVASAGSDWLDRFDECWSRASTHSFTSEDAYGGDDSLFYYCSLYAMGRTCLRHRHLGAPMAQVIVWDGETTQKAEGTYGDRKTWLDLGYASHVISVKSSSPNQTAKITKDKSTHVEQDKKLHALLFGDIKEFSKLSDRQLPIFVQHVMGCLAQVLQNLNADDDRQLVLMTNTWGDGLFVVLENVEAAANCATAMQKALSKLDLTDFGFESAIGMRLGAHFGPVYELLDPVTSRNNYFGEHVNRAARIEPITPAGEVYVTEPFAAQLALNNDSAYRTEYVGRMPMAKEYGELRMYLLKQRH